MRNKTILGAGIVLMSATAVAAGHGGTVTVQCRADAAVEAKWQAQDNWRRGLHSIRLQGMGGKPDGLFRSGESFTGILATEQWGYTGPVEVEAIAVDATDGYVYRRVTTAQVTCPEKLVPPTAPPAPPDEPVDEPATDEPTVPQIVTTPPVTLPPVVKPPRKAITCATLRKRGAGTKYLRAHGCLTSKADTCKRITNAIRKGAGKKWIRIARQKGCIGPKLPRVPRVRFPIVAGTFQG